MSWLPTGKREVSGDEILKKSNRKTTATSIRQKKDVFTFSPDAPLSTGGKNKTFMNASAISNSHIYHSSELRSTTKKEQPVAKKRHVKKHLFSDTDTDYATTDVSWLKESSRKPKPKVTKYPRPVKPKATSPRTSYESPDLPSSSQKPVKCESKPKKRKTNVKERVEQPKKRVKPAAPPNRPQAADRRPQRAAAISAKSYKEPDTEESQSESEMPSVFKRTSPDHLENAEKTHEVAQVKKKKTASKQPTKNYPKPENNNDIIQSESASELPLPSKKCFVGQRNENTCSEVPKGKKRKHTSCDQSTDSYRRADSNNQSALKKPSGLQQQRPENVDPEISKLRKTNVSLVQEQTNALKDSWAACQASFSSSPVFSERMRSAERSDPTLGLSCSPLLTPLGSPLPASPDPACQDTPSPILLLPKPCSTVNSKGNFKPSSIYSAGKKHGSSKAQSIQSVISLPSLTPVGQTPTRPHAGKMSPAQQSRPSPPPSRLPLLTSTMLELDKPSMTSPPESPFPEDIFTHGRHYGFRKVCSESQVSLTLSSNQSSVLSSRDEDSPTAVLAIKTEESPPSSQDLQPQLHVSGPSLKRCVSSSNTCEGEQKEARKKSKMRERHSPRMKPRKLFNSFAEVSAESEVIQVMSSSEMVSSSHWEAEVGDEDMDKNLEFPKADVNPSHLCQQFSSELKRVKDRSKMMEVYSRQSLKTIQQHFSSLNMQVTKYRSQRRKKVDEVLLEEIHKLEQDDTMLKSMERDLAMYWKKQSVAFHSYKELKNRRKETLAKALQSNVCHGLEYEERLFTSQMGLVRKDMKSFQDRLLCQMQEVEILSVKRGLHALFFP